MSCWAVSAPGSSASAASARSSSSRVARIRAALGRSGSAGLEALDLARLHRRAASTSRQRASRSSPSRSSARRTAPAARCASALLFAEPGQEDLQPSAVGGRRLVEEAREEGDRDVAVAALAERVGKRLDLLQRRACSACAGKQGRNISSAARRRRLATRMSCTRLDVVEVEDARRSARRPPRPGPRPPSPRPARRPPRSRARVRRAAVPPHQASFRR